MYVVCVCAHTVHVHYMCSYILYSVPVCIHVLVLSGGDALGSVAVVSSGGQRRRQSFLGVGGRRRRPHRLRRRHVSQRVTSLLFCAVLRLHLCVYWFIDKCVYHIRMDRTLMGLWRVGFRALFSRPKVACTLLTNEASTCTCTSISCGLEPSPHTDLSGCPSAPPLSTPK